MIHVFVYLMNGEVYDLSLTEGATVHDVKQAIPGTYSWQARLFPFELPSEDSTEIIPPLEDHVPVEDKTSFRAFMEQTDTRIFSVDKESNLLQAMTHTEFFDRLTVYYLETGERTNGHSERLEDTPQTEYYLDMDSVNEWVISAGLTVAQHHTFVAYIHFTLKGTYKGLLTDATDRYHAYLQKN